MVLILWGEILSWSSLEFKGSKKEWKLIFIDETFNSREVYYFAYYCILLINVISTLIWSRYSEISYNQSEINYNDIIVSSSV